MILLRRKIEYLNEKKMELPGMKNAISKMKFLLNEINSRLNNTEEMISELETVVIKLSIMNKQGLSDTIKLSDIQAIGVWVRAAG